MRSRVQQRPPYDIPEKIHAGSLPCLCFRLNESGQVVSFFRSESFHYAGFSELQRGGTLDPFPAELRRRINSSLPKHEGEDKYFNYWTINQSTQKRACLEIRLIKAEDSIAFHIQDVTRRVKAEKEQQRLVEDLMQLQNLDAQANLAANIAHEFNNLLMGVLSQADLAQAKLPSNSPASENLERISRTSSYMSQITQKLLSYAGKTTKHLRIFNLNCLAKEQLENADLLLSEKIKIQYKYSPEKITIFADCHQVKASLMSLVNNAVEALESRSGTISVTTGIAEKGPEDFPCQPWLQLEEKRDFGYIEIVDDGAGMAQTALNRLFSPYYTTKGLGRGLSLPAVLGTLRSHGGAYEVYSALGEGTTFRLYFPLAKEDTTDLDEASELLAAEVRTGVLVAEDEESVRSVVAEMLETLGHRPFVAKDGHEAVELFKQHQKSIGLALIDAYMPGMSGIETLGEIREIEPTAHAVIMSGFHNIDAQFDLKALQIDKVLSKPFRIFDLSKILCEVF